MPHFQYLNRHWLISSDDFPLILTCTLWIRMSFILLSVIIQLIWSRYIYTNHFQENILMLYYDLCLLLFALIAISEGAIIQRSLHGKMIDYNNLRNNLIKDVLDIRIYLLFCQVIFLILGIICFGESFYYTLWSPRIHRNIPLGICLICIIYHTLDTVFLVNFYYGLSFRSDDAQQYNINRIQSIELWKLRCIRTCNILKFLTCNLFGGSNIHEDLESVASVLTDLLHHDGLLDVVFTDIVAGIILVNHQQVKQIESEPIDIESHVMTNRLSVISKEQSFEFRQKIYRYCLYATSIYSYMLRFYMAPMRSAFMFTYHGSKASLAQCGECLKKHKKSTSTDEFYEEDIDFDSYIEGYDPCWSHRTAVGVWTQSELQTNMIYCSVINSTRLKPYAVFYDQAADEIVVSIRGTLSFEDCVTDALAEPAPIPSTNDSTGSKRWAHEGILLSAMSIRDDIQKKSIFKNIIASRSATIRTPFAKCTNVVNITITGHSLGGGIAALLALLLKPEYPQVQCFTFGAPGSVVDLQTSYDLQEYVTNIVLGDDMISRVSFHALLNLKIFVLDSILRSNANKMAIFHSILKSTHQLNMDDLIHHDHEPSYNSETTQNILDHIQSIKKFLESRDSAKPQLFIPGKVYHVKAVDKKNDGYCCYGKNRKFCTPKLNYDIYESSYDELSEILVTSNMAWDHFPDRYIDELKRLSQCSVQL